MPKLQLFINGLKIADCDIFPPSFSSMDFQNRCDAMEHFIKMKSNELYDRHVMALLKCPNYEIVYLPESRGNMMFMGVDSEEIKL